MEPEMDLIRVTVFPISLGIREVGGVKFFVMDRLHIMAMAWTLVDATIHIPGAQLQKAAKLDVQVSM
jgi:hypothetical protein